MNRSDYMLHQDPDGTRKIQQVEFNTMASSMAGLSQVAGDLHRLKFNLYPLLSYTCRRYGLYLIKHNIFQKTVKKNGQFYFYSMNFIIKGGGNYVQIGHPIPASEVSNRLKTSLF